MVITLCGSTRYKDQFLSEAERLTLDGNIVISVGVFKHKDNVNLSPEQIKMLNFIHLNKIDMSDSIHIVNPGGYIGEQTSKEIQYAKDTFKNITYMEVPNG